MSVYKFSVTFILESKEYEERIANGYVCANSYSDAADELTRYFGESETGNMTISWYDDGEVIIEHEKGKENE